MPTLEQFEELCRRRATGESYRSLGRAFGLSHEWIRNILLDPRPVLNAKKKPVSALNIGTKVGYLEVEEMIE